MVDYRLPQNPDDRGTEVTDHIAHRPTWDCRQCRKPWPCDPAREAFMATMNRVERAVLMWVYLEAAAEEIRDMPLDEIFARFIRWTR
jgi:hypothetical protein